MKPPSSVTSFVRAYLEKHFQKRFKKQFDQHLAKPLERIKEFGFAKTRRAIAALSLSFFVTLYLLLALNAPAGPEWTPAFLALALCYLVAFVGVVAEWFWGAWFASGLGWSGVMVAVLSTALVGWNPALAIYGGLHGLVVLLLLGKRVAALYEQQDGWKQQLGMDDYGVARLRKTVTRAAASLPSLVLWALGPKEPEQGMLHATLLIGAAVVGIAGLGGMLRLRGWSIIAVAVSAVALIGHGLLHWGLRPGLAAGAALHARPRPLSRGGGAAGHHGHAGAGVAARLQLVAARSSHGGFSVPAPPLNPPGPARRTALLARSGAGRELRGRGEARSHAFSVPIRMP